MNKRWIFIFCLSLMTTISAAAQQQPRTRTVTNTDLEKYKQKRLAAERDYNENYARMGFPSPSELESQRAQEKRELNEYSERLRQERIARENADAARSQIEFFQSQLGGQSYGVNYYAPYGSNFLPFYPNFGFSTFGNYTNYRGNRGVNNYEINRLRQTDFINRRNGYNSPFSQQNRSRLNF